MSLTTEDLQQIRTIVRDEVRSEVATQLMPVNEKLDKLAGRLEAVENDIKDIYQMISDLQKAIGLQKSFLKLDVEKKIHKLYAELLQTAKEAGITLPRS